MRFAVLIYGDEDIWDGWDDAQGEANSAAHGRFAQVAGDAIVGGAELSRTREAYAVRAGADGQQVSGPGRMSDGTLALGGYYVLECDSLEDAVALAAQLPEASAPGSGVEVRPLVLG